MAYGNPAFYSGSITDSGQGLNYSGWTGALLRLISGPRTNINRTFGRSVCGLGALDGDGRSEWRIGAEDAFVAPPRQGRVAVMRGRTFASAALLRRGGSFSGAPEPRLYVSSRAMLGAVFYLVNDAGAPAVVSLGVEAASPLRVGFSDGHFQLDLASSAVIGLLHARSSWPIALLNERARRTGAGVPRGVSGSSWRNLRNRAQQRAAAALGLVTTQRSRRAARTLNHFARSRQPRPDSPRLARG